MTSRRTVPDPLLTPFDRVIRVEPGRTAEAVRTVPSTLFIFDSHFPRFPVLPGVLLLESVAAVARLALPEDGAEWQLTSVAAVRFRHFVQPGDTVRIAVQVVLRDAHAAVCSATVTVDDQVIATAQRVHLTAPAAVPEVSA